MRLSTANTSEHAARRWVALVALCVGQLMIVLDATVVNVALPSIQTDLHFSAANLAWVVNGYLISFGGLLLLAGRLGDLVGRKSLFLWGLGMFTAASFLCGVAGSEGMLIAGRFLQGAGAAVVSAMVLGIVVTIFSQPRERATAMSVYAFVASAGGAIGLVVGGVVTQALSWHWIFFINLPIGVAAAIAGVALIPHRPGIGLRGGVDLGGALLVTAAPSLAVYTILRGSTDGWTSPRTLAQAAGVGVLLLCFVVLESRLRNPLMPLRIFRSRNVVGANVVRALLPIGMFGSFFLGALYLQRVLGYSPLRTGFAFLPANLTIGFCSLVIAPRLVSRIGAKATLVPGLLLITAGLLVFARAPVGGSFVNNVLPSLLLTGTGAGLTFMPSVTLAMADADPNDSGLVSGLANVSLQVGASLGVAMLASISAARAAGELSRGVSERAALTSGYDLAFVAAAAFVVAGVALALLLLRDVGARAAVPIEGPLVAAEQAA